MVLNNSLIKNYYKILGIDAQATTAEIKKQYRLMAFLYHPDKQNDSTASNQHFALINEAYNTLINPQKRIAYDKELVQNNLNFFQDYSISNSAASLITFVQAIHRKVAEIASMDIDKTELLICLLYATESFKIGLINASQQPEQIKTYKDSIIDISAKLSYNHLKIFIQEIENTEPKVEGLITNLKSILEQKRQQHYYRISAPWIVLLASIIICFIIYFTNRL